jgi:hypothetical protein
MAYYGDHKEAVVARKLSQSVIRARSICPGIQNSGGSLPRYSTRRGDVSDGSRPGSPRRMANRDTFVQTLSLSYWITDS